MKTSELYRQVENTIVSAGYPSVLAYIHTKLQDYYARNPVVGGLDSWQNYEPLANKINLYFKQFTTKQDIITGRYICELYRAKNTSQRPHKLKLTAIARYFLKTSDIQPRNKIPNSEFNSGTEKEIASVLSAISVGVKHKISVGDYLKLLEDLLSDLDAPSDNLLRIIESQYKTCTGCANNYDVAKTINTHIQYLLSKTTTNFSVLKFWVTNAKVAYLSNDIASLTAHIEHIKKAKNEINLTIGENAEITKELLDLYGYIDTNKVTTGLNYMSSVYADQKVTSQILTTIRCAVCKFYSHGLIALAEDYTRYFNDLVSKAESDYSVPSEDIEHNAGAVIVIKILGQLYNNTIDDIDFIKKCKQVFGDKYQKLFTWKAQKFHLAYMASKLAESEVGDVRQKLLRFSFDIIIEKHQAKNMCLIPPIFFQRNQL